MLTMWSSGVRFYRPLAFLIHVGTVCVLVWAGIRFFAPPPEVAPLVQAKPSAKFRMNQAAEARLLGVETAGGLTPPAVKLLGVFASSQGNGAAVMSIEGGPAIAVDVGDDVANGWKLTEVAGRQAVISRSGQQHRVRLPEVEVDRQLLRPVR